MKPIVTAEFATRVLVIVPCGGLKVWKKNPNHGPCRAESAYVGPPFKVNRKFAERFGDSWIILSAKYGFIEPAVIIPRDYNVTFKKPSTRPITLEELTNQAKEKGLLAYNYIVALGGEAYCSNIEQVFRQSKLSCPTKGLRLGEGMQYLNSLLTLQKQKVIRALFDGKQR